MKQKQEARNKKQESRIKNPGLKLRLDAHAEVV